MLPDPILVTPFGSIYMYGVMISLGLICCFLLLWALCKKFNYSEKSVDFLTLNAFISIALGFLSAALFQAIYTYIDDPSQPFRFSGITFLGGLIGGAGCFLIIFFIFKKKHNINLIEFLPIASVCIVIAHAFGRVGCFFAGCCYGKATDSWLGVKFPNLEYKVLPTNLFEAIFLFILLGILILLFVKKVYKYNFPIYLISYGIWRFFIEFFRGDFRGTFILGISPSQFWSIVMCAIGISLIFFIKYKTKNNNDAI